MEHKPERGKWTFKEIDGKVQLVPYVEVPKPRVHTIRTDHVPEGIVSMITGEVFDSRSRYERHVKEHGYEIVGHDMKGQSQKATDKYETDEYNRQLEEDTARAYYDVRDGMAPLTELDKEMCKTIDNQLENGMYKEAKYDDGGNDYE